MNLEEQAEPPAPPRQVLSIHWWGRRFRLPCPLAGYSFTASLVRGRRLRRLDSHRLLSR